MKVTCTPKAISAMHSDKVRKYRDKKYSLLEVYTVIDADDPRHINNILKIRGKVVVKHTGRVAYAYASVYGLDGTFGCGAGSSTYVRDAVSDCLSSMCSSDTFHIVGLRSEEYVEIFFKELFPEMNILVISGVE